MDAARMLLVLTVAGAIGIPGRAMAQTSNFAGQSNWSGATSPAPPAAGNFDRYGEPITPIGSSVTERAQNAFSGTSSAIQDGVEAGIQAAQQGINKVSGQVTNPFSTSVAAAPQSTTSRTGVSSPWTNTPTAPSVSGSGSWPATPSMGRTVSANSAGVTPINGGWTSIGTAVAAPPLLVPQSPMTIANFGGAGTTAVRPGPTFPSVAANDAPQLHSVLADPAKSSATNTNLPAPPPADDWISNWGNNSGGSNATIGRTGNAARQTTPCGIPAWRRCKVAAGHADDEFKPTAVTPDSAIPGRERIRGRNRATFFEWSQWRSRSPCIEPLQHDEHSN